MTCPTAPRLECTPQGLQLVDMVEGLDHAALEQLV